MGVAVEGPPSLKSVVNGALNAGGPIPFDPWTIQYAAEARRRLATIGGLSYIPSPFYAGRCPRCRGEMQHIRWQEDENWWPDLRRPPDGMRYFRVPDARKAAKYAREGYGGAELVGAGVTDGV